jgi:hypothetical protein
MSSDAPLYHGTSLSGLLGIVRSGVLYDDGWEPSFPGASLTRSFDVAKYFAGGASVTRAQHAHPDHPEDSGEAHIDPEAGSGGAVIEFDRELLARTHEFRPYAYGGEQDSEEEERIVIAKEGGTTAPLLHAVRSVHLVCGVEAAEKYRDFVLAHPNATPAWSEAFEFIWRGADVSALLSGVSP